MHILTKIFIVLVSLLAVLLVPLVVVYATNENNFKARYQDAEARAATKSSALSAAEARAGAEQSRLQASLDGLRTENTSLQTTTSASQATIRQLQSQLAASQSLQADINARLATITSSIESGHELTESLVSELRSLRADVVTIERQKVELDEALREVSSQLEVAEQARRALAEELARLKDEHSQTMAKLGQAYAEGFGSRSDVRVGVIPDKTLTANIIRVHRSSNQVLAEIDAGSRDGVKKDWILAIAEGGTFIANLRIIEVDINHSTGVVTLENRDRGNVKVGHVAHAVAGQE